MSTHTLGGFKKDVNEKRRISYFCRHLYIKHVDICIITPTIMKTTRKQRLLKKNYFSFTFILNITKMNESDIINLIISFYEANRHLWDVKNTSYMNKPLKCRSLTTLYNKLNLRGHREI